MPQMSVGTEKLIKVLRDEAPMTLITDITTEAIAPPDPLGECPNLRAPPARLAP